MDILLMRRITILIHAMLPLIKLMTSKRYRKEWRQSMMRMSEADVVIEASMRRLEARENGGKPRFRLLDTSINCDESHQN